VKTEFEIRNPESRSRAFSIVELLTVIGILAILIAMLMPALGRAREQANQVACLAALRQVGLAGQLHAAEHNGHLPTAGWHWQSVGGVTNPAGIEDATERKYEYYLDNGIKRPAPVTVALGKYLGVTCRTHSREALEADLQLDVLRKRFRCPSQQFDYHGWTQRGDEDGNWFAPEEYSSYAFNEALLGRRPGHLKGCPKGRMDKVLQPSKVFFALDGRPRDLNSNQNRCFLVPDKDNPDTPEETLYVFQQRALAASPSFGGRELLDFPRHNLRINAIFVDGHAEGFTMGLPPEGGGGLHEIHVTLGFNW
jgi:prepilin-type processing-associated H-X9-DG protein